MPIIEYDTYKQKLGALEPQLTKLAAALDLPYDQVPAFLFARKAANA